MPDERNELLFSVEGLAKAFAEKQVLRNVTFDVPHGAATVLIGPSSSGKSVLFKCLLGLMAPDGGRIAVEGRDRAALSGEELEALLDRVGVAFQQNALFDSMTCWENVAFRLLQRGSCSRKEARERAVEVIGRFGLRPEVADRFPAEISGGMQKRIALARAFVSNPRVLMLDAPTDGLDPIMTRHTNQHIRAAVEGGTTVFMITADMRAAQEFSDRLMMLYDGEIIWSGSTGEARQAEEPRLKQLLEGRSDGPIRMAVRA